METVTSVVLERARPTQGLEPMIGFSVVLHAAALALIVMRPAMLGLRPAQETPKTVVTISFTNPQNGGMTTPIGDPSLQTTDPATKSEPLRPPAPKPPEMIMPSPSLKTPPLARANTITTDQATARTPMHGGQDQAGRTTAPTGAWGIPFGVPVGGGETTGWYLGVRNFCCPDYITTMLQLIQQNWSSKQGVAGENMVKFTILRDGRITDVELEKPSGYYALDMTSQRTLLMLRRLPPLPSAFSEDHLTVHLRFQYQR